MLGRLGWITLGPDKNGKGGLYFVDPSESEANPKIGLLKGTAWSEISGPINFSVTGQKVVIDPVSGEWEGWAWASGPYGGWVKFDCKDPSSCVRTTWREGETPSQAILEDNAEQNTDNNYKDWVAVIIKTNSNFHISLGSYILVFSDQVNDAIDSYLDSYIERIKYLFQSNSSELRESGNALRDEASTTTVLSAVENKVEKKYEPGNAISKKLLEKTKSFFKLPTQ